MRTTQIETITHNFVHSEGLFGASRSGRASRVAVFGSRNELLRLRIEDELFSRRPLGPTNVFEELLAIRDEDFRHYTTSQRSNRVWKFAPQAVRAMERREKGHPSSEQNSGGSADSFSGDQ
jgi:hypothetical protein